MFLSHRQFSHKTPYFTSRDQARAPNVRALMFRARPGAAKSSPKTDVLFRDGSEFTCSWTDALRNEPFRRKVV